MTMINEMVHIVDICGNMIKYMTKKRVGVNQRGAGWCSPLLFDTYNHEDYNSSND